MIRTRPFLFAFFLLVMVALRGVTSFAADRFDNLPGVEHGLPGKDNVALERYYEEKAHERHEMLARYYGAEEKKNHVKARELKQLLEHYGEKSYLYGKKAQDLQAHTDALLRKHSQAARMDAAEAASHRRIALTLKEKIDSAPGIQNVSALGKPARRPSPP